MKNIFLILKEIFMVAIYVCVIAVLGFFGIIILSFTDIYQNMKGEKDCIL